jgi:hypothetical protein
MTSLPCVRTQRHLHKQKLLTFFGGKFTPDGGGNTSVRTRMHYDVTPLRTYATSSTYAKTADFFGGKILPYGGYNSTAVVVETSNLETFMASH